MSYLNRIFLIIFISLPTCKEKEQERFDLPSISPDTMLSVQKDTIKNELEVLKMVKVPDIKNDIVDSVEVFGSLDIEYNQTLIDSIIVHSKSNQSVCLYRKVNADIFENQISYMYFEEEQNCFAHFNNDNFIDLFFSNIGGGSGGRIYNVFLMNPKEHKFKYHPLLSYHFNLSYVKKSNHYISIGKSGGDRTALRFEIRKDTIRELSRLDIDFLKGGTTKHDTTIFKYTYKEPNKDVRIELCYFLTEIKSEKEIKKCSKFMQNIENQIWEDWQLH